jgi:hypothetical protein
LDWAGSEFEPSRARVLDQVLGDLDLGHLCHRLQLEHLLLLKLLLLLLGRALGESHGDEAGHGGDDDDAPEEIFLASHVFLLMRQFLACQPPKLIAYSVPTAI